MKSLGKNAFYNVVYKCLNVVFPLVTMAYVSRVLLPVGVGKVASAQNIVAYFVLIASLGLPVYGVKVMASYSDNREKSSKSFSELFCINAISTIICSFIYIMMVLCVDFFHTKIAIAMVVGIQLFANIINIDWLYQGFEEYRYITIRSLVVKIIALVAVFIFVKDESDYIVYALITTLSLVTNFVLNVFKLRSFVELGFKELELRKHLKPVLSLLASTIAIEIYVLGGTTMLSIIKGDEDVAYYTYATKAVSVVRTFIVAVCSVFLPRLNYYYSHNQIDKFNKLSSKGVSLIINLCLPTAIGLFLLANDCVQILFGQEYLSIIPSMQILCITIITIALSNFIGYQILVTLGKEKLVLYSTIIGAIINVVLNVILIVPLGYIGASIATAMTELVIAMYQYFYVCKYVPIQISIKEIIKVLFPSIVMIIPILVVFSFELNIFVETVTSITLATATFFYISYKLGNELIIFIVNKLKIR